MHTAYHLYKSQSPEPLTKNSTGPIKYKKDGKKKKKNYDAFNALIPTTLLPSFNFSALFFLMLADGMTNGHKVST